MTRSKMKILVDGGDPQETRRIKELLGFVDGQTTIHLGLLRTRTSSPLVGDAVVPVEVFSDLKTTAQDMLDQGRECSRGFPMRTSSNHARQKASVRHRCQSCKVAASNPQPRASALLLRGRNRLATVPAKILQLWAKGEFPHGGHPGVKPLANSVY